MGSAPGWSYGYVPTAGEWNLWWSNKQDNLGYTPLSLAGGTMTGLLITAAPAPAGANFNLSPGVAPTAPNNGDLWTTAAGLFVETNGATWGPLLGSPRLSVIKRGVSFQSAADILLSIPVPNGFPSYYFAQIRVANASGTLTTGSIGVFTGSAAGGTAVVASTALNITSIAGNTSGNSQILTIASPQTFNVTQVYVHITGSTAATADVLVEILLE